VNRILFAVALTVVLVPGMAQAHPDGSYPRTMNLDWTNNPNVVRNAKYDMVALSARATTAKFDSIKALNPASLRLVCPAWYVYYYAGPSGYTQTMGPFDSTDPYYGFDRKFWDLLQNNNWWAWGVDSAGTKWHTTPFPNMWLGNLSTSCPPNAQGKRLCDVFGDFIVDELVAQKGADGIFLDQLWDGPSWFSGSMYGGTTPGTFPKCWFDLDNNGVADDPVALDAGWKAGVEIVFARVRQRMGSNFVIMGNGQHHYATANGAMHERFPRLFGSTPDPAPNPYNYKWQWAMFGPNGYLTTWTSLFSMPRRNLIDSEFSGGTQTLFPNTSAYQQLFRFNLGSTLLGDGYLALNSGSYNCTYWQPEYDLHLGFPLGPAYSTVLSGVTVWRRDFQTGESWVNPTGVPVPAGANNPAIPAWDAVIRQTSGTIGVDPAPASAIALASPRPNPMASDGTTLTFTLAAGEAAQLVVIDLRGRQVRHLWTGVGTGDAQVALWDGRSDQGWVAPAGVYFARIEGEAGRASQQKLIRTQ
jgi:hypothetical protein